MERLTAAQATELLIKNMPPAIGKEDFEIMMTGVYEIIQEQSVNQWNILYESRIVHHLEKTGVHKEYISFAMKRIKRQLVADGYRYQSFISEFGFSWPDFIDKS